MILGGDTLLIPGLFIMLSIKIEQARKGLTTLQIKNLNDHAKVQLTNILHERLYSHCVDTVLVITPS